MSAGTWSSVEGLVIELLWLEDLLVCEVEGLMNAVSNQF